MLMLSLLSPKGLITYFNSASNKINKPALIRLFLTIF